MDMDHHFHEEKDNNCENIDQLSLNATSNNDLYPNEKLLRKFIDFDKSSQQNSVILKAFIYL